MRHPLILYPDFGSAAVTRIEVEAARPASDRLVLRFVVTGAIDRLRLAAVTEPARTDELWKHTCFEAFVQAPPGAGYLEFNLAPSTQWAAYRFDGYREGMTPAAEFGGPSLEASSGDGVYELQAALDLGGLLPAGAGWRVGLSAVIEEVDGRKSYWALAHPPGQADFHHPDCFALELAAGERP
jgi:hypothetical protein